MHWFAFMWDGCSNLIVFHPNIFWTFAFRMTEATTACLKHADCWECTIFDTFDFLVQRRKEGLCDQNFDQLSSSCSWKVDHVMHYKIIKFTNHQPYPSSFHNCNVNTVLIYTPTPDATATTVVVTCDLLPWMTVTLKCLHAWMVNQCVHSKHCGSEDLRWH